MLLQQKVNDVIQERNEAKRIHKRFADTKISLNDKHGADLEIVLGLRFDGYTEYEDLRKSKPEISKLVVYTNPKIKRWKDEVVVSDGDTILDVTGSG